MRFVARLYFIFILVPGVSYAKKKEIFSPGEHCVAWKTKKTLGLVKSVKPVGKNCEISTLLLQREEGMVLVLNAPIEKFDSGNSSRDKEVYKILKSKKQSNLEFKSNVFTEATMSLAGSSTVPVQGELKIGGVSYPVTFNVSFSGQSPQRVFRGTLVTKYSDLGIRPPKVLGGVIAKVKNYLELHFQFTEEKLKKSFAKKTTEFVESI